MSTRDPKLYLSEIIDAIEAIEEYTAGITEDEFGRRRLIQDGVVRRIEIIGEAARQLPQEVKDQYANVPWIDIVGMRNRVIHEYFGGRIDRVWNAVQRDLPELKAEARRILSRL